MNEISILIVEDDPLHAAKLEMILRELGYHVLPIAQNVGDAMALFKATQPDLLVLDIFLHGNKDGIDLANSINGLNGGLVPIIFLTSMNDADVFNRAKETQPYAYLLKPIDRYSIQHTIELALTNTLADQEQKAANTLETALRNGNNLFIKSQKSLYKVSIDSISVIEVSGKYCKIYSPDRHLMVRTSLKDFVSKLPAGIFLQTHRNYLVNVNAIQEIELDNDRIQTPERAVPVSKNYKSMILNNLDYLK